MYVKAFTFGGVFIWLVWMASATPHYVGAMASHEPSDSRPSLDRLPRLDANITRLSGDAGGADDRAVVCDWTVHERAVRMAPLRVGEVLELAALREGIKSLFGPR